MSLQTEPIWAVPGETARVARLAFPKGNVYLRLRDELGLWYQDNQFAGLFSHQGRPAESPGRLALVTVMPFAEGLTDRQAADAVRRCIDWKYLLGLELTDPGFDASLLSEFRDRLIDGQAEQQLLDDLLARCRERGLLKARGRQCTDSTHVLAAIRVLNRLELVGKTMRATLNALATVAPDWLRGWVPREWFERYGPRFEQYRLPKEEAGRRALAESIGADGQRLLSALYEATALSWLREVAAVETLRQVWLQQFYLEDRQVRFRQAGNLPPGADLIQSPYDAEARYREKRSTTWKGYQAHLTETCDDDTPHRITHVETTPAPKPDVGMIDTIHAALSDKDLLPSEHIVDAGYVDAGQLVRSQEDHQVDLLGPVAQDTSWQARAGEGFDVASFVVDWGAQTVTCPQGRSSRVWSQSQDSFGNEVIEVRFARADGTACPVRSQCTQSQDRARSLKLRAKAEYLALQQARGRQATPEFKARYARRAGIEGTISQGTAAFDLRRARYLGLAKTHLQHVITAAAINLTWLAAWWGEVPLATTRTSRFAALTPPVP